MKRYQHFQFTKSFLISKKYTAIVLPIESELCKQIQCLIIHIAWNVFIAN